MKVEIEDDCKADRPNGKGCEKCHACLVWLRSQAVKMADRDAASAQAWEASALRYLKTLTELRAHALKWPGEIAPIAELRAWREAFDALLQVDRPEQKCRVCGRAVPIPHVEELCNLCLVDQRSKGKA